MTCPSKDCRVPKPLVAPAPIPELFGHSTLQGSQVRLGLGTAIKKDMQAMFGYTTEWHTSHRPAVYLQSPPWLCPLATTGGTSWTTSWTPSALRSRVGLDLPWGR